MCCFSQAVEHVGGTKIFARGTRRGTQMLVYSMSVRTSRPVAMILPLPVPPRSDEDAVRFIDLSAYPRFFEDMPRRFPRCSSSPPSRTSRASTSVSGCPTRCGKSSPNTPIGGSPSSSCHQKRRSRPSIRWRSSFHRDPRALFFPTVHIHDGNIHPSTDFDHDLYCQADGLLGATLDWTTSVGPLGAHVEELKARGVVRAASPGFTLAMNGTHPNHDMVLHTSDITFAGDVVSAEGDCWAVRLHGAHARRDPKTVAPDRLLDQAFDQSVATT